MPAPLWTPRPPPPAGAAPADIVDLLDGGAEAFPRMVRAIEGAQRSVILEVYIFQATGWGQRFLDALAAAAQRGVAVRVTIDGWGSAVGARHVVSSLKKAGAKIAVYNPLAQLLLGRFRRNHRKILLVDDEVAYLGGINIGDEYAAGYADGGWADLAVEVRGPACQTLGRVLRGGRVGDGGGGAVRIYLSGARGGGGRLRRRYLKALHAAQREVLMAQAYFLPDARLVRAIARAARRGVKVTLLLAGRSDVPLFHAATMRLYARLLKAGVLIYEWTTSVLHAKACVVDGNRFLVGSFNLDPLSLANQETLVEVHDPEVAWHGRGWIASHVEQAQPVTAVARTRWQRWVGDRVGLVMARLTQLLGRLLARG